MMKAAVNDRYGSPDVLEVREVPTPRPQSSEILVKVHATTVSRTDREALRAHPFFVRPWIGLLKPKRKILGLDFAGEVVAVGTDVSRFSEGDHVFGLTPGGYGAHAEYVCVPANGAVAPLPEGKRYRDVVLCEGAWYAQTYLEKFGLGPGDRILIYGASGAIGIAAVQLAKFHGADVTAVVSTSHVELVRSLGADQVIDYTAEDFTGIGETFDYILDAVGKTSYFRCRPLLKPQGVFSATDLGPWWQNIFLSMWFSLTRSGRVVLPMPEGTRSLVEFLKARIECGELRAVIDRSYSLSQIADAYRYVSTGKKVGIVVIEVVNGDSPGKVLPDMPQSAGTSEQADDNGS